MFWISIKKGFIGRPKPVIHSMELSRGPFKYVIKEVGGWGQKLAIFDDLQCCKSSKRWVGLKKSKT
jgi:hypothetical protein